MPKHRSNSTRSVKPIAPDDITPDMWVTITHIAHEHPSWLWGFGCDSARRSFEPLLRVLWRADDEDGAGLPMRVMSVCLPFVLVRNLDGEARALDVRRHRLVRVSKRYAREARQLQRARKPGEPDHKPR